MTTRPSWRQSADTPGGAGINFWVELARDVARSAELVPAGEHNLNSRKDMR